MLVAIFSQRRNNEAVGLAVFCAAVTGKSAVGVMLHMSFRILSLSGGGFMGLYTATVLEMIEKEAGRPIHQMFDLIAGTSIGGITALGLSAGVPAAAIAEAFKADGPKIFSPAQRGKGVLGSKLAVVRHAKKSRYSAVDLRRTAVGLIGESTAMGGLLQRTVIPAVNLTRSVPQSFRTPHHPDHMCDAGLALIDVALATSAAPTFFPIHRIGDELFTDGSLYANYPGEIALHEARYYLDRDLSDIHILSIGATLSQFSFSGETDLQMGWYGWVARQNLPSVMISIQQANSDMILSRKLGQRYLSINRTQSDEQSGKLALDVATPEAIEVLTDMAQSSFATKMRDKRMAGFLNHRAPPYLCVSEATAAE